MEFKLGATGTDFVTMRAESIRGSMSASIMTANNVFKMQQVDEEKWIFNVPKTTRDVEFKNRNITLSIQFEFNGADNQTYAQQILRDTDLAHGSLD